MGSAWRNGFSNATASRGISYYRNGNVLDLETHTIDNMVYFSATVKGTDLYRVSGQYISGNAMNLDCTCPYEYRCKHMYAVLCAVENKFVADSVVEDIKSQQSRAARKKAFKPFQGQEASPLSGYKYFKMDKVTENLSISSDLYDSAKSFINKKKPEADVIIAPDSCSVYKGELCSASIRFEDKTLRTRRTSVVFSRDSLISTSCEDYSCISARYSSYGRKIKEPCVHILACLIMAEEYVRENDIGDSTSYDGMELLNSLISYNKGTKDSKGAKQCDVVLCPRLIIQYGEISAGFKIGFGKKYVVKSISELCDAYVRGDRFSLGKDSFIDFSSHDFDEKSKSLYKLVSECADNHEHIANRYAYGGVRTDRINLGSQIGLYGAVLDRLFCIFEGDEIELCDKDELFSSKTISLCCRDPYVFLNICRNMDSDGEFDGVVIEGNLPEFIMGTAGTYYLDKRDKYKPALCILSNEAASRLAPLKNLSSGSKVSAHIGRRKLSEFYHSALPVLKECAEVIEPDKEYIDGFLTPEPKIVFYMDAVDGLPFCHGTAQYGEDIFNIIDTLLEDRVVISKRASTLERRAAEKMNYLFPVISDEEGVVTCVDDDEEIFRIINEGLTDLSDYGEVQCTDRFQNLLVHRSPKIRIGISADSELLNLEISSDISQQELLEVLRSYKQKKKFHRLRNGNFIDINAVIADLSDLLDAAHISPKEFCSGKMNIPAYRALYLDRMLDENTSILSSRDMYFKKLIRDFKTVSDSDFEVPVSLQEIMRPYQLYGYKWLRTLSLCRFGGILADDMGLGKTLQTISVLLASKNEGVGGTSLIVCPSSLVYNWIEEIKRFAPSLTCEAVAGNAADRSAIIEDYSKFDILVTSYDILKRDVTSYEGCEFLYQILDEAQYIKTHTTVAAKSVKLIRSRYRIALTGTPIENRLSELWSIFDFLMPGFLYGYETFKRELETPIVKKGDEAAAARLKRMVSPFILRRLKSDVLKDLPEKMEENHYVRFDEAQQKLYDGQVVKIRKMLQSGVMSSQKRIAILSELTKIRQICCDPSLIFEDYGDVSSKRAACLELVRSAIEGEHRILLFSQFTSMLELLENDLQEEGIEYYKITGATPKAERLNLVNKFNKNDVPVFLVSLKAGGTGLNLTGADTVIHYDPWWNVAAMNQATDRAHRIGQERIVSVYKLIAKGTIEEKILQMQRNKQALADDILSGNSASLMSLSQEELLDILS